MTETLPAVHVIGDLGHTTDHNTVRTAVSNIDARLTVVETPGAGSGVGTTINARSAPYNMATGASAATNTAGLQAAINAAAAAGGGTVFISVGTYNVNVVTHPAGGGLGFGTCVAAIKSNVRVCGEPASPTLTVLKMQASASFTADTQNRFFTNWNMNGVGGAGSADHDITVQNMTIDGNCANNTTFLACCSGMQMWNVKRFNALNVITKNHHGENGSTQETFALDSVRCEDFLYRDVVAICDDGGNTASGITANYSNRGVVDHCTALNMTTATGFTYYSSQSIMTSNCYAGGNNATGINNEECWDLTYTNCVSGAETTRIDGVTQPVVFTPGALHPNNVGFVCLFNHGGGRIVYSSCHARGNTGAGFRSSGALTFTATTGTTGSTVVLTTASMYQTMIGRYVQVGAGRAWVRVTAVTGTGANATFTTDAAHGGASGDTVLVLSGEVEWKGGTITGNGNGVQPSDGTVPLRQLSIRTMDFTQALIKDNTLDLADVGNGSANAVTVLSGILAAALTDNWSTTVEFYNPFPMDMIVYNISAGAITSLRGGHPKAIAVSSGSSTNVLWIVPRGGAITITNAVATNVKWAPLSR